MKKIPNTTAFRLEPSSFRDPAGFLFMHRGVLYRQVNLCYQKVYDHLIQSGFYSELSSQALMISHAEFNENLAGSATFYLLLKPDLIPFISYPYEWCFSQMKDAALFTLKLQLLAMEKGMSLKDATPFNLQFKNGKPILIDSLSFEFYDETKPWVAYRQFCEMFLYPLLMEHYCKVDAIPLLMHHFNGIPAKYLANLLPWKAKWNLGVRLHVLLQAGLSVDAKPGKEKSISFTRQKMKHLVQHLQSVISSLNSGYPVTSVWNNYYESTILGKNYLDAKEYVLSNLLKGRYWDTILDLGANDGHFSKLVASHANLVIATDFDAPCIDRLYKSVKNNQEGMLKKIVPLVVDWSNPTPALGFSNAERASFLERGKSGLVMALALIHHLCISKGISMGQLAAFFSTIATELIVEFVPREDEKVKLLLSSHSFDFPDYNLANFEQNMSVYFQFISMQQIGESGRLIYFFQQL